jgi:hypothetical protein
VFGRDHERFGPADHKVWHTAEISSGSVGRSDSVPAGLIPPPVLESINGLLDGLGYLTVDETWGTADMPAGLLTPDGDTTAAEDHASVPQAGVLADRLAAGLERAGDWFAGRGQERIAETFTVVIRQPNTPRPVVWRVNLGAQTLVDDSQPTATTPDDLGDNRWNAAWSMVGTVQAWLEVLAGRMNLSVALRRNELRYCDFGENDAFVAEDRIALLATFLSLPYLPGNSAIAGEDLPALAGGG